MKEDADWLINTTITTNYDEICFAVGGDSKYAEIVVANESGIVSQVRVDGKITSYALTKDYVLCGLEDWEETGKYHLLASQMYLPFFDQFSTTKESAHT